MISRNTSPRGSLPCRSARHLSAPHGFSLWRFLNLRPASSAKLTIERRLIPGLLIASLWFPGAVSLPAAEAAYRQAVSEEAEALLSRLKMSDRADLGEIPALPGARLEGSILVHTYPALEPLYYLTPVAGSEGGILGLIAVQAETGAWGWYTFGFRGEEYPPVGRDPATRRVADLLTGARTFIHDEATRAVTLPDRQVYWLVSGTRDDEPFEMIVPFDDPAAEVLSSIDGGLPRYLDSLAPSAAPSPAPERLIAPEPAAPLARPDVYVIPGVPFHFQIRSWYCGPASAQMLMDFSGEEIGQHDLADVMNDDLSFGTYTDDNRRACHFSGMSVAVQNPELRGYRERALGYAGNEARLYLDAYNYVKNHVYRGYPLQICTCYDAGCGTGHYRVIKGYDDALNEFIVHDPWYNSPYWGPDVHFNQQFLVDDLWRPWSNCWGLMAGPWELDVEFPSPALPGDTIPVGVDIYYPGPGPFAGRHPATSAAATIHLPPGFSLASGTTTVPLPNLSSGDTAHVDWEVVVGESPGLERIGFQAQGIVIDSTWFSYPVYTDSIGGHARAEIVVGEALVAGWEEEERLTDDPSVSATAYPHARALYVEPTGVVHIVWADGRDGNSEIYYRRWDGVWGPEERLTSDAGHSYQAAIAGTPTGELHVVWADTRNGNQDVYYRKWDGVSWSGDLALTTHSRPDLHPAVAVDGLGQVHVVWYSSRVFSYYNRVLYRKWDGVSWTAEEEVASPAGRDMYYPSVAADATGRVHLVFEWDTGLRGPADIYYCLHDGMSWSSPVALTLDSAYAHCPSVAVGPDSVVHVVWHDGRHLAGDIYYRRFAEGSWGSEVHAVDHAGDSQFASVAAAGDGTVHVVWEDYRDGGGEIYYKSGPDLWSDDVRLTHERHASSLPCVGVDEVGDVCVVWADSRDGNNEIYCRRSTVPSLVGRGPQPAAGDRGPALITSVRPVPAGPAATLEFRLPREDEVMLRVFDVRGRRVRTLLKETLPAGRHLASWDGRDEEGRPVASGVYFCRLEAAGLVDTKSLVILAP